MLSGFVEYEYKTTITKLEMVRDHGWPDLLIIDYRELETHPFPPLTKSDFYFAPRLALVSQSRFDRKKLFDNDFSDFFLWPINKVELRNRINFCLSSPMIFDELRPHVQDELLQRACTYLFNNISMQIDLTTLVAEVGSNRNSLSQRFKSGLGTSPMSWFRALRMKYAMRLVRFSLLPIADISARVGYEDSNNFSTAFRREFGISPAQARRLCKIQRKR